MAHSITLNKAVFWRKLGGLGYLLLWCGFFGATGHSPLASARWVEATGYTIVAGGGESPSDYSAARFEAQRQAVDKARELFSGQSDGSAYLRTGATADGKEVQAAVRDIRVLEEKVEGNLLSLRLSVDLVPRLACALQSTNRFRKKTAVLGFSLQVPSQAALGGLADVSQRFPAMLAQQLKGLDKHLIYGAYHHQLYSDVVNAPAVQSSQGTLTKAVQVAKEMGVQFVVSGVIRDLSPFATPSPGNSAWATMKSWVADPEQRRRFRVEVFIHDGFSGEILTQQIFETVGNWNLAVNEVTGFGSGAFLASDYGKQVSALLDEVTQLTNDTLSCQPFMARINRMQGKTLHFDAGALSGLRPGDELAVYRTYQFSDSDGAKGTELTNVKTALKVTQVHPDFATGVLPVDPGRLNIQTDDLLIGW